MSPVTVYNARPPKRGPAVVGVVVLLALFGGTGAFLVSLRGADDGLASVDAADVQETSATAPQLALPPAAETTTTLHALELRRYRPGDCVIWDKEERQRHDADTQVVDCEAPHFLEMTGSEHLEHPFDAPYPTELEWDALFEQRCGPKTTAYLGYDLWDNSRFYTGGIRPLQESWADGHRDIWCGIAATPPDGGDGGPDIGFAFAGRVKGQDQSWLWGVGTCLADGEGDSLDPVSCDQPHVWEVSGTIDLAGRAGATRPVHDGSPRHPIRRECSVTVADYLGRPVGDAEWVSWFEIDETQWAAGRRRFECIVSRWADGADDPTTVTGPRLGG